MATVTSELFDCDTRNRRHCWGWSERQSPPDIQRDRLTDRERRIARARTHTHTLRGSVQRFGCKLWSSARETFGGRERGGSMFSLRCTWIPQIIRGSRLGAHWDDRVIGTFLICLSSRCDRADKLADPESFVALGAGFLPPSEENKDDSAYLLIYSLLSLKNQQTLAVPCSKNAK